MLKVINDIKSKIPAQIPGFICIKRQEVLIPYMELGIDCLTRNISELNLFFETILKLIEIDINDISEISNILGVSFGVIKEAIVDMVSCNYVSVSENTLRMTKKGKEALKSKKLVVIKKNNLNNVMVNLITGEILNGDTVITTKANKGSVCLAEKICVNKYFLDSNFQKINEVFQIQQESNNVFGKSSITKELYKLISIHYKKLKYVKNHVSIYKSETSNELQFLFDYDKNNIYLDTLYEQLQIEGKPSLANFFERDRNYSKNPHEFILDETLYMNANETRKELLQKEDSLIIPQNFFNKRRYSLFDQEYISYFYYSNQFNFTQLFICSNRVNSILSPPLYNEIIRISEKTPVYLIYDKGEFNAKKSIEHFLGKKTSKNLYIIPCDSIKESIICFDSELLIEVNEYTINTLGNVLSYKMPIIDFDKNAISDSINRIKKNYNIDKYLESIKQITQR